MTLPPIIRLAARADAPTLAHLARRTFIETYASETTPDDLAAYLEQALTLATWCDELGRPDHSCLLAVAGPESIGYAQLRKGFTPPCIRDAAPMELARLYVLERWIGRGVGSRLMQGALDLATTRGASALWLGVWDRNSRAIAFYRRWGFRDVGSQLFPLGGAVQTDRVMRRDLQPGVSALGLPSPAPS